jgi:hypothetical protein
MIRTHSTVKAKAQGTETLLLLTENRANFSQLHSVFLRRLRKHNSRIFGKMISFSEECHRNVGLCMKAVERIKPLTMKFKNNTCLKGEQLSKEHAKGQR